MSEVRNIVFLGASFAGLGSAHYFLKHVYPRLPNDKGVTYRAVVVDPSSKFFWRPGSPLAAVNAKIIPASASFLDINSGLNQYGDKVLFIQGAATSWDIESRNLTITASDGSAQVLPYHALILATGARSFTPILSLQGGDHFETQSAHAATIKKLEVAKKVVILGGGASGVEIAGELGEALNGSAGWCSSHHAHPNAEVTLYTSADRLLPALPAAVGVKAEKYLRQLGVNVVYSTKLSSWKETPDGSQTAITLPSGEVILADIFIPAMGVKPNTSFAPARVLDDRGYVRAHPHTLRVEEAGPRVYAAGDVASYTQNSIPEINGSVPVLASNLQRDLLAAHNGDPSANAEGVDRLYNISSSGKAVSIEGKATQLVPIGRKKGVGVVFGWQFPSTLVWAIKGRDYMVSKGQSWVDGSVWNSEVVWKGN